MSTPLSPKLLHEKYAQLRDQLASLQKPLIAYSGGVDSAFLAWVAHQVRRDDMLAVIADSPSLARSQFNDAIAFAREHAIPLEVITTSELEDPDYVRNDGSRCFHCKDELFAVMEKFQVEHGFGSIAYGVNLDDQRTALDRQNGLLDHQD